MLSIVDSFLVDWLLLNLPKGLHIDVISVSFVQEIVSLYVKRLASEAFSWPQLQLLDLVVAYPLCRLKAFIVLVQARAYLVVHVDYFYGELDNRGAL